MQTLDKFIEEEKQRLDNFAAWYREERKAEGASAYPMRRSDSDWITQLQIYGYPKIRAKLLAKSDKLWDKGDNLWLESRKLWNKGLELRAEARRLWAEGDKLEDGDKIDEGNKLWAEGNKLWAESRKIGAEGRELSVESDKLRVEALGCVETQI